MLVLTRKPGETVIIGNAITLTVLAVSGNQVRVGIAAPHDVRILRAELASSQYYTNWQLGSDDPGGGIGGHRHTG